MFSIVYVQMLIRNICFFFPEIIQQTRVGMGLSKWYTWETVVVLDFFTLGKFCMRFWLLFAFEWMAIFFMNKDDDVRS